jgi:hypothetical protein
MYLLVSPPFFDLDRRKAIKISVVQESFAGVIKIGLGKGKKMWAVHQQIIQ